MTSGNTSHLVLGGMHLSCAVLTKGLALISVDTAIRSTHFADCDVIHKCIVKQVLSRLALASSCQARDPFTWFVAIIMAVILWLLFVCCRLTRGWVTRQFIDIDSDLYTSTKQALTWMFRNQLVVPGTLVGYDDWVATPPPLYSKGESRAHAEIAQEFGVQFELVRAVCRGDRSRLRPPSMLGCAIVPGCLQYKPIFRVVSISFPDRTSSYRLC